jgi:RHS repeat-associated protein
LTFSSFCPLFGLYTYFCCSRKRGAGQIGGLLNLKQGGNDYNYLYDGKGNVTALIDSTQSPVVTYAYDPFGVRMKQVGTFEQPYQFSTKPYDPQTGLSNFDFRYYNAGLGRWMTRDPLGERGGVNLYRAMGNDLVNRKDPFGLFDDGRRNYWPIEGNPSPPLGHDDFTGGNYFNYSLEDRGSTSPWRNPERHFRDLSVSEADVDMAIATCNKEAFERAMHRGQDYFSHYKKGYRWNPGNRGPDKASRCNGYGHACDGTNPDEDEAAWKEAEAWSKSMVDKWNVKCGCKR